MNPKQNMWAWISDELTVVSINTDIKSISHLTLWYSGTILKTFEARADQICRDVMIWWKHFSTSGRSEQTTILGCKGHLKLLITRRAIGHGGLRFPSNITYLTLPSCNWAYVCGDAWRVFHSAGMCGVSYHGPLIHLEIVIWKYI